MNIYAVKRFWFKIFLGVLTVSGLGLGTFLAANQVEAYQDPPTPPGVYATVIYTEPINVRGGPSTVHYPDIIGRLNPGDIVPALGVTSGREWVQIAYPDAPGGVGWVYAIYVSISGGELLVVETPSTPTPPVTATIDATLVAAFNVQPTASRIPTFTPPPPLTVPHYTDTSPARPRGVPPGYFVISLVFIGALGLLVSFALRK